MSNHGLLINHIREIHEESFNFFSENMEVKCTLCLDVFDSYQSFIKHNLSVHQEEKKLIRAHMKCKICDKVFSHNSEIFKHITKLHNEKQPFKCHRCQSKFAK